MSTFHEILGPGGVVPLRAWLTTYGALLPLAWVLGGLGIYSVRTAVRGIPSDPELEDRRSGGVFGRWIRMFLPWLIRPLWRSLRRSGLPADAVTRLSFLLAAGAGIAAAQGGFVLAGWLYLASGVCDFLDGRLAREHSEAGPAGAALDSILDRYAEAFVLAGLAWAFRADATLILVLAAFMGSMMVSYVRARGEGLGVTVSVGLMQRPERLVLLGLALVFAPLYDAGAAYLFGAVLPHRTVVWALGFMAIATNATAIWRVVVLRRSLVQRSGNGRPSCSWTGTLAKNSAASVAATIADYATVFALMGSLSLTPGVATTLAASVGALVHFTLGRGWAFGNHRPLSSSTRRYVLVSATSAVLNGAGVALLAGMPGLSVSVAWVIARVGVYLMWNHPLQRDYVFVAPKDPTSPTASPSDKPSDEPSEKIELRHHLEPTR